MQAFLDAGNAGAPTGFGKDADEGVGGPRVLVCTHATFRFAVEKFGVEAFDDRLIAMKPPSGCGNCCQSKREQPDSTRPEALE